MNTPTETIPQLTSGFHETMQQFHAEKKAAWERTMTIRKGGKKS